MRRFSFNAPKTPKRADLPKPDNHSYYNQRQQQYQFKIACSCPICTNSKFGQAHIKPQPTINYSLYKSKMKFFLQSISKSKKKPGFKVQILDACFYENGKPETLFVNGENSVSQIDLKDRNPAEIVKILVDNTHRTIEKWNKRSMELLFVRNMHLFLDIPVVYEKFIRSLIPSHLESRPRGSQVRHIEVHNNRRLVVQSGDENKQQNISVVYFSDGYCCVLNEVKLRELLLTQGKNIPYIMMLTSFIEPKNKESKLYSYFSSKSKEIKENHLYTLACREVEAEMGILNNLDEEFPSQEQLEDLKRECNLDPQKKVDYQTYKIIAYLERQANINANELVLGWVIGEENILYLSFVYEFDYQFRFIEHESENKKELINRELEQQMIQSWEITKQTKAFSYRLNRLNPRKDSEIIFKEMFPDGDFDSLQTTKIKIRSHRSRLIAKNPLSSMSTRLREESRTPSIIKTIDRSTEMRSITFSRRVSQSVSPKKRKYLI